MKRIAVICSLMIVVFGLTGCNNPFGGVKEEPNLIVSLAGGNARFAYPPETADLAQMNAVLFVIKEGAASGKEYSFPGNQAFPLRIDPGNYTITLSLFYKNGGGNVPLAKSAPESVTVLANQVTKKQVTVMRQFAVSGVTVSPSTITVAPGTTRQFSAIVTIDEALAQDVTWEVTGAAPGSGTAISPAGILSVDAAETAASLTLTAKSTLEKGLSSAKVGDITVTVDSPASTMPDNAKVTVDGNYWVGQTLTASTVNLAGGTASYQWKSGTTNIGTGSAYTLAAGDKGKVISVEVTYDAYSGTIAGALTRTVQDKPSLPSTATVTITGTPAMGQTLTANAAGFPDGTLTHQWKRNNANITGATGATYTLAAADVGKIITVEVSHPDYEGSASSEPVEVSSVFNVASSAEWTAAANAISTGGNDSTYTINITGAFTRNGDTAATFGGVTGISVTVNGGNHAITLSGTGSLLRIGADQTVIMNALTLYGNSGNNTSLVYINGAAAAFTMHSGAVSGNTSTGTGGGVAVIGGAFTMSDGKVSGNTGSYGGGVYVQNGAFTMTGGAIGGAGSDKNTATTGGGGGVFVFTGGVFTMSASARVSGNTGGFGGGVAVEGGEFTMSGGEVSGNTSSTSGGGVNVYKNGEFTMNTGKVSGNMADTYGGGVYISDIGTFTMKGGEVSGNSAADSGGGVYVNNVGANNVFHITHGTVYGTNETNAALRNTATTGAALWKNGGTAVYGNGAGTPIPLTAGTNARDVTIEVNNGVLTLPSLSSISVTGPTKTTYTVGQHLDTTGMVVTAHYSDGTTETVTGYTLSDFNSATTGTKTITVSYQGKTATFSVTVSAYAPQPPDDATVIYVAASPGQGGEPTSVLWTTAVSTVNNASSGTNFAIIVVQDIGISGASFMTNTFTKANLNLYLAGKTGTETVTLTSNGTLLTIGSYSGPIQNVTMDGLTLKGQGIADGDPVNDNSPLVRIWTDCTFTMKGGEISGNTSSGVSIDGGIFNMSGSAKVSGNIVNGRGGGVYVQNGTFNMLGGEVSGNKASQGGGGVTFDRSTFNMSGGKISGNTASGDGGGGVDGGIGTFNMSGGEISGNTASGAYGTGGGARITGSNFYISNGTIYGNNESSAALRNTATNSGAALYIAISRTAEYGTFNGETWNKIDDIPLNTSTDRDATLRVENGVLQ